MQTDPTAYLPLTMPTFYILLSLAADKKHGYAILGDVERLSEGKVRLSTSTLYSTLGRLLDQGLIERVPGDLEPGTHPGLPRKAYILTDVGHRVLQAELDRIQALLTTARLHLRERRVSSS